MVDRKAIWSLAILVASVVLFFTWPVFGMYVVFPLDIIVGIFPFIIISLISFTVLRNSVRNEKGRNKRMFAKFIMTLHAFWMLFLLCMSYLSYALRSI